MPVCALLASERHKETLFSINNNLEKVRCGYYNDDDDAPSKIQQRNWVSSLGLRPDLHNIELKFLTNIFFCFHYDDIGDSK